MTMPINAQNTKSIRIGFIGAGGICRQRHLPGLNTLDNIELVAVCNRSQASGQKIADEFGVSEVMTDWKQLLDRDDIDASISSRSNNCFQSVITSETPNSSAIFCPLAWLRLHTATNSILSNVFSPGRCRWRQIPPAPMKPILMDLVFWAFIGIVIFDSRVEKLDFLEKMKLFLALIL